jgi:hypothetical protein
MYRLSVFSLALSVIALSFFSHSFAEVDQILQSFLSRGEPMLETYQAHRTLVCWSEGFNREGRLEAISRGCLGVWLPQARLLSHVD